MNRRGFLTGILLTVTTPKAQAQQPAKVHRVAVIAATTPLRPTPIDPVARTFVESLLAFGYTPENLVLERRSAEGAIERVPQIVRELVSLNVDVIVTSTNSITRAVKEATQTIPIVMLGVSPVEEGLIHSFAQPGGNVTGVTPDTGLDFFGKWVEILKEILPRMSQIAVLEFKVEALSELRQSAALASTVTRELGVKFLLAQHAPLDYADAFALIAHERPDALIVGPGAEHYQNRSLIVEFATKNRLPTMYTDRQSVAEGGLISYGPDFFDLARRLAGYVDRILKGAKPRDLAVERPTKFLLTINLKTANSIGVAIPPTLLARADEVIE